MKKILALLLALCMVFALAACGEPAPAASDAPEGGDAQVSDAPEGGDTTGDKVIKIGVFEPQSGDNGAGGKQEILGMQYANSLTPTVEVGGETYTVELVYADNQSSNDKAVSAAQTLIAEGCSVVLGSYGSGVSIAAATTFGDAGVPAIGVTCTNPQVTQVSDTYYRICFIDPFQGTVLANYAKSLGATKAYCLAKQGDDYSVGLVNYFVEAFGAENCVQEVFQEGTSDYSSYVTNAKSNGCDIFVAPVSTEAAALIIDQAATQDLGMPILAGDTWDSNVIVGAAQGNKIQSVFFKFVNHSSLLLSSSKNTSPAPMTSRPDGVCKISIPSSFMPAKIPVFVVFGSRTTIGSPKPLACRSHFSVSAGIPFCSHKFVSASKRRK